RVKTDNPRKEINIYLVEFMLACGLFILGITDIYFGYLKNDLIYIILGLPLVTVFIITNLRLIIIKLQK
ncbi:MAG: hypothetical protein ACFFDN_39190, partial [Candidatus Hodarchaeota archaeon]